MGMTNSGNELLLDEMTAFFDRLYLVTDPSNLIASVSNWGVMTIGQLNESIEKIDSAKTVTWGEAIGTSPGAGVSTTNSATSNPMNFSVPKDKAVKRLLLTDDNATENSRVVYGIIDLATPLPDYTAGDGAYFVRKISLTLTES